MTAAPTLYRPGALTEAVSLLAEDGRSLAPLAGATWVMRSPLRQEPWADGYVCVTALPELRITDRRPGEHRFGAALTHAQLAVATAGDPDLLVLHQAAAHSANPAVRHRATLGGNLAAIGFPAADLIPALLSLDARVTVVDPAGRCDLPLADYLRARGKARSVLLTEVVVPRRQRLTGHARLTLRRAGDYPVAIVSVALATDDDGIVRQARVAVGSVEPTARRWPEVEPLLVGRPVDPVAAGRAARQCAGTLHGRDGVEAPGWYRERVAPVLLQRAVAAAAPEPDGEPIPRDGLRRST